MTSELSAVRVLFYDQSARNRRNILWPVWWLYLALRRAGNPVRFYHCCVETELGVVYDCASWRGCYLRFPGWVDVEAADSICMWTDRLDDLWWRQYRRFTPFKTFLHTIGAVGPKNVINCATAAARLLGMDGVKTPNDLYERLKDELKCGTYSNPK